MEDFRRSERNVRNLRLHPCNSKVINEYACLCVSHQPTQQRRDLLTSRTWLQSSDDLLLFVFDHEAAWRFTSRVRLALIHPPRWGTIRVVSNYNYSFRMRWRWEKYLFAHRDIGLTRKYGPETTILLFEDWCRKIYDFHTFDSCTSECGHFRLMSRFHCCSACDHFDLLFQPFKFHPQRSLFAPYFKSDRHLSESIRDEKLQYSHLNKTTSEVKR